MTKEFFLSKQRMTVRLDFRSVAHPILQQRPVMSLLELVPQLMTYERCHHELGTHIIALHDGVVFTLDWAYCERTGIFFHTAREKEKL